MADQDDTIEVKGLEQILKALKKKAPVIKVGILGGHDARSGKTTSNATIGAVHEFGDPSRNIPQRSFLRMPISTHLQKEMEASGEFDKETLQGVIKTGNLLPWAKKIAAIAEQTVAESFLTSGWGQWSAWKNPKYENNTGQLLIDTQQLRESISSTVEGG